MSFLRIFAVTLFATLAAAPAWATPVPVPEPQSMALLISGLLALIACRARKILVPQIMGAARRVLAVISGKTAPAGLTGDTVAAG